MPDLLFKAFNQHIRSAFAIPGASVERLEAQARLSTVLEITEGKANLKQELKRSGAYSLGREGIKIEIQGVGSFLCDPAGYRIVANPLGDVSSDEVSAHLLANAIPTALWLQGKRLLHAAAAILPGKQSAVVIAGPSRSGKSTILENLLQAGATIVSEDVSCVDCEVPPCRVSGLSGGIQLRSKDGAPGERLSLAVPESQRCDAATPDCVLVMRPDGRDSQAVSVPQRLHGADALQALLQNRYRQTVPRLIGREALDLPTWICLSESVPVYSWNPWQTDERSWCAVLADLGL